MTLVACGIEMSISHLGDDFLIVRESSIETENCDAELIVNVDGIENRRKVKIEKLCQGGFVQATYSDPNNFLPELSLPFGVDGE
jgi:hypothetical protein